VRQAVLGAVVVDDCPRQCHLVHVLARFLGYLAVPTLAGVREGDLVSVAGRPMLPSGT